MYFQDECKIIAWPQHQKQKIVLQATCHTVNPCAQLLSAHCSLIRQIIWVICCSCPYCDLRCGLEGGGTYQGIKGTSASRRMRTGEATIAGEKPKMLQQKDRGGLSKILCSGHRTSLIYYCAACKLLKECCKH